jgi:hypothetical protein
VTVYLILGALSLSIGSGLPASANQVSQVLKACQADGATVSTAIAAFEAQNPGLTVTEALLVSNTHGGPYLQNWPGNRSYYIFTLTARGLLRVQSAKAGSKPIVFSGPASCTKAGVGLEYYSNSPSAQVLRACQADGATVSTAIAAFEAQNPGSTVTEASLVSNTHGGPYLQNWPGNRSYYIFTLTARGVLRVQSAKAGSKPIVFSGPASCTKAGVK